MTKLIISKKVKVITILGGTLISLFSLYVFILFICTELHSIVTWGLILPLFIIFTILFIFSIRESFFAYCSFDDESGIEFYSGFTKIKQIPVSSLQDFITTNKGLYISYKTFIKGKEKTKSIYVSTDYKNLQLLNQWLNSHTRNVYAEQISISIEEFKASNSELSDEEKGKLLKKLHLIRRILTWSGAIIAVLLIVSIFLDRRMMQLCFIICSAYPLLLFMIMRFSNGQIRFNVKNTSLYPSVISPFCFCSVALCMLSNAYLDWIVSFSKQFFVSAIVILIMYFLYYICASESEKKIEEKRTIKLFTVMIVLFFMFLYGFGFSISANILFDKSEPVFYEVTVINQRISNGKHPNYYFDISPWIDGKTIIKEISIGQKLYSEVDIGDTVKVKLHKGFLGVPWFKTVKSK